MPTLKSSKADYFFRTASEGIQIVGFVPPMLRCTDLKLNFNSVTYQYFENAKLFICAATFHNLLSFRNELAYFFSSVFRNYFFL